MSKQVKPKFHEVTTERFNDLERDLQIALAMLIDVETGLLTESDETHHLFHAAFLHVTKAMIAASEGAKLPIYWGLHDKA